MEEKEEERLSTREVAKRLKEMGYPGLERVLNAVDRINPRDEEEREKPAEHGEEQRPKSGRPRARLKFIPAGFQLDREVRAEATDNPFSEFWGRHGNGRVNTSYCEGGNFDDYESDDYDFVDD